MKKVISLLAYIGLWVMASCNSPSVAQKRFAKSMDAYVGNPIRPHVLRRMSEYESIDQAHGRGSGNSRDLVMSGYYLNDYKMHLLKNGGKKYIYTSRGGCQFAVVTDSHGIIQSWQYIGDPKKCVEFMSWAPI